MFSPSRPYPEERPVPVVPQQHHSVSPGHERSCSPHAARDVTEESTRTVTRTALDSFTPPHPTYADPHTPVQLREELAAAQETQLRHLAMADVVDGSAASTPMMMMMMMTAAMEEEVEATADDRNVSATASIASARPCCAPNASAIVTAVSLTSSASAAMSTCGSGSATPLQRRLSGTSAGCGSRAEAVAVGARRRRSSHGLSCSTTLAAPAHPPHADEHGDAAVPVAALPMADVFHTTTASVRRSPEAPCSSGRSAARPSQLLGVEEVRVRGADGVHSCALDRRGAVTAAPGREPAAPSHALCGPHAVPSPATATLSISPVAPAVIRTPATPLASPGRPRTAGSRPSPPPPLRPSVRSAVSAAPVCAVRGDVRATVSDTMLSLRHFLTAPGGLTERTASREKVVSASASGGGGDGSFFAEAGVRTTTTAAAAAAAAAPAHPRGLSVAAACDRTPSRRPSRLEQTLPDPIVDHTTTTTTSTTTTTDAATDASFTQDGAAWDVWWRTLLRFALALLGPHCLAWYAVPALVPAVATSAAAEVAALPELHVYGISRDHPEVALFALEGCMAGLILWGMAGLHRRTRQCRRPRPAASAQRSSGESAGARRQWRYIDGYAGTAPTTSAAAAGGAASATSSAVRVDSPWRAAATAAFDDADVASVTAASVQGSPTATPGWRLRPLRSAGFGYSSSGDGFGSHAAVVSVAPDRGALGLRRCVSEVTCGVPLVSPNTSSPSSASYDRVTRSASPTFAVTTDIFAVTVSDFPTTQQQSHDLAPPLPSLLPDPSDVHDTAVGLEATPLSTPAASVSFSPPQQPPLLPRAVAAAPVRPTAVALGGSRGGGQLPTLTYFGLCLGFLVCTVLATWRLSVDYYFAWHSFEFSTNAALWFWLTPASVLSAMAYVVVLVGGHLLRWRALRQLRRCRGVCGATDVGAGTGAEDGRGADADDEGCTSAKSVAVTARRATATLSGLRWMPWCAACVPYPAPERGPLMEQPASTVMLRCTLQDAADTSLAGSTVSRNLNEGTTPTHVYTWTAAAAAATPIDSVTSSPRLPRGLPASLALSLVDCPQTPTTRPSAPSTCRTSPGRLPTSAHGSSVVPLLPAGLLPVAAVLLRVPALLACLVRRGWRQLPCVWWCTADLRLPPWRPCVGRDGDSLRCHVADIVLRRLRRGSKRVVRPGSASSWLLLLLRQQLRPVLPRGMRWSGDGMGLEVVLAWVYLAMLFFLCHVLAALLYFTWAWRGIVGVAATAAMFAADTQASAATMAAAPLPPSFAVYGCSAAQQVLRRGLLWGLPPFCPGPARTSAWTMANQVALLFTLLNRRVFQVAYLYISVALPLGFLAAVYLFVDEVRLHVRARRTRRLRRRAMGRVEAARQTREMML